MEGWTYWSVATVRTGVGSSPRVSRTSVAEIKSARTSARFRRNRGFSLAVFQSMLPSAFLGRALEAVTTVSPFSKSFRRRRLRSSPASWDREFSFETKVAVDLVFPISLKRSSDLMSSLAFLRQRRASCRHRDQ